MASITLTNGTKIMAPLVEGHTRALGVRPLGGHPLHARAGGVRPSGVRARKSLFDKLTHRFAIDWTDKNILDGFAGAGTLGFEALTRGSASCLFIDSAHLAVAQIKKTAAGLGLENKTSTLKSSMVKLGRKPQTAAAPPADIVFLDPPYHQKLEQAALAGLAAGGWLKESALIIIETAASDRLDLAGFDLQSHHIVSSSAWLIGQLNLTAME